MIATMVDWNEQFADYEGSLRGKWINLTKMAIGEEVEDGNKEVISFLIDEEYDETVSTEEVIDYLMTDGGHLFTPLMNYAYQFPCHPDNLTNEKLAKAGIETNTCVMEDEHNGNFYLALTGAGMDFSQDIAVAFSILFPRRLMPLDWYPGIQNQSNLSLSDKNFNDLAEKMISDCKWASNLFKSLEKTWERAKEKESA